ncbi:MAG: hypothetical protein AABW56_00660 [Nanoarchaeota archaeon]
MKNEKRIYAIIQARMNSARFMDKVMKEIMGVPLLKILVERIKESKLLDGIIIATTTNPKDDIIEEYCKKNNINVFRGSENDLVERLLFAAKAYDVDIIVEQGVDCPLVDSKLIDSILEFYFNNNFDYITTLNNRKTIPDGYFARLCPTKLLEEVYNKTREGHKEGELGLSYIEDNPEIYKVGIYIPKDESNAYYRLTIDEEKDLQLVRKILENFNSIKISMLDIIKFLNENKTLSLINKDITHTEKFLYKIGLLGDFINNFKIINNKSYHQISDYKFAGFRFISICSAENKNNSNLRYYEDYKKMFQEEFIDIVILDKEIKDYDRILKICEDKGVFVLVKNWENLQEVNNEIKNFLANRHISQKPL